MNRFIYFACFAIIGLSVIAFIPIFLFLAVIYLGVMLAFLLL